MIVMTKKQPLIHILPPSGEQGTLLSIHADGKVTFGDDFTTIDDASLAFWQAVADAIPAFKNGLISTDNENSGWAMADHIKALEAKVADLQAEVDAAKLSAETAWGAANDIQHARRAAINSMKPVVDAAVMWERHFSALAGDRLVGAVRDYMDKQK